MYIHFPLCIHYVHSLSYVYSLFTLTQTQTNSVRGPPFDGGVRLQPEVTSFSCHSRCCHSSVPVGRNRLAMQLSIVETVTGRAEAETREGNVCKYNT